MEQGVFVIAFGQVVVGDLRAQVMDVMKTDVPTEPLQDERQLVKGTALQTGLHKFPAFVVVPVGRVKIMLDVEKPDPDRGTDHEDRQLHHEIGLPPDQPAHQGDHRHQRKIGPPDTGLLTPSLCWRNALGDDKDQQWANSQQGKRITHDAVGSLLPPRRGEIFPDGHRIHVACAAPVEVTGSGMMDRMIMLPAIVGRKVQKGGDPARQNHWPSAI